MPLRSKKYAEIKGFLRRPQTLRPKFSLDVNVEEYIKQCRKYKYYNDLANGFINYYSGTNKYFALYESYKRDKDVVDTNKFKVISVYNKLKNSELYDTNICKMGLAEVEGNYYLGIHFPKLFLTVVNDTRPAIELRDVYFYFVSSSIYVFRTTVDAGNPDFIHPHVHGNFSSYCLGSSPLKMSLDNLHYQIDTFTEDDADIFWVNFYRTITQKTEHGDHYYALSKLGRTMAINWEDFVKLIYNDEKFISNFHNYINIGTLPEEIAVSLDYDAIKKDFFNLFSYEATDIPDKTKLMEKHVKFDDVLIKNKKVTSIYKASRKMYNNIDGLLLNLLRDCAPLSLINNVFDDYKEKSKEPNNSGEQSTGQNQVFEFQVL
jgi:hypothetical protein